MTFFFLPLFFFIFNVNVFIFQVLQYSGLEGEHIFLQVDDHILKHSSNLNSINSLISCGEIPNLYSSTELDSLVKALENQYRGESFEGNLSEYFFKSLYLTPENRSVLKDIRFPTNGSLKCLSPKPMAFNKVVREIFHPKF